MTQAEIDYMEEVFDLDTLKEIGFFPKGTRRKNYQAMADRICQFFELGSIMEYEPINIIEASPTFTIVTEGQSINSDGVLIENVVALISTCETEFQCPICTKEQDANDFKSFRNGRSIVVKINCQGCKRPLELFTQIDGTLTVIEP